MKKKLLFSIMFLLVSLVGVHVVAAQDRPIVPPMPPIWDHDALRIEYQWVDVEIQDQVATTRIDQLFVNDSDRLLEGIYLFPLPQGAAVNELTMWVDGQPIEAKILEADEARDIYDEIVRQMRDPALLEYVGTSAIQANVFPIPALEERRIEISYTSILPAENGLIHYVYPQSTELYSNQALDNQRIRVEVQSDEEIRTIYSPSHQVAIDRDGAFRAIVGFEDEDVLANEDFELYYTIAPEDIGLNLLSFKEADQDGFFLLLVAPAVEADTDDIVAKDVILVLDTSGSMEGQKMRQAKEAATFVIDNLNAADRFNIVAFSTGVRNFARSLVPADDAGDYGQFIERLEAVGGTNISGALLEAVAQAGDERPTTIIFLTDGHNIRLFAFGVGDDVDTTLLDGLTQNHRGATTYVRPGQDIEEAVGAFYAKVSTPVLANISLDFGDIVVEQMYPPELPDLFAGTQLVLTGRYRDGGPAAITLSGEINGRQQRFTYEDNVFRSSGGQEFIPRLWATRAIGNLLTQIRLKGEDPELVQSVIDLSIRYGIITPYTSYLIEEDDIFSQSGRDMIVEEAMEEMIEVTRVVTGREAVDAAADEAGMAAAEAPLAPMPQATMVADDGSVRSVGEVVQAVGSKAFILRDGTWIDTAFEANSQLVEEVAFASDAYFELLSAAPDLGRYLALGPSVLVVHDGRAYQIVESDSASTVDPSSVNQTEGAPVVEPDDRTVDEPPTTPDAAPIGGEDDADLAPEGGLCASSALAPLALIGLVFLAGRRRSKNKRFS